jgi:trehalose-phosphatase
MGPRREHAGPREIQRKEHYGRRTAPQMGPERLSSLVMIPSKNTATYLFDCWGEISRRVKDAGEIRLFLDFDGTLVAFTPLPDQVQLEEETSHALRKLAGHPRVQIAIISGRRRSVLAHHIKIPGVKFMGMYGWEDKANVPLPARRKQELDALRKMLADLPFEVPGVTIENKGISVAVHFRGASAVARECAHAYVRKALGGFRADLHVIESHNAWDIVPREIRGKGAALGKALKGIRKPFLSLYVGDDTTDEPAFTAARDGITVRVGPAGETHAHYRLQDPDEVRGFLIRLGAELT